MFVEGENYFVGEAQFGFSNEKSLLSPKASLAQYNSDIEPYERGYFGNLK